MRPIDAEALKATFPTGTNIEKAISLAFGALVDAQPTVVIAPAPPVTTVPAYRANKAVVFSAPYSDASNWVNGRTSSYPPPDSSGVQVNPNDSKLDAISPNVGRPTDAGVFTASKITSGVYANKWWAPLVTTEGSVKGFQAKTGDVIAFDILAPTIAQKGGWPALWTWNGPNAELDCIEMHNENITVAELTNHVTSPIQAKYPAVLNPGKLNHFEVVCGAASVSWYINGTNVYSDTGGVGSNWSAYLIANLSVEATNQYHPGPDAATTAIVSTIANLAVYR